MDRLLRNRIRTALCYICTPWHAFRQQDIPGYLTAIFTLILAIFAFLAFEESKEATQKLQGQLDAARIAQRAWIYFDLVPDAPVSDDKAALYVLRSRATFHNVGHEPATNVWIRATGALWAGEPKLVEMQDKLCTSNDDDHPYTGASVFPDQSVDDRFSVGFLKKDVVDSDDMVSPFAIVGCVKYSVTTDKNVHTTRFAYVAHVKSDAAPGKRTTFPKDPMSVPLEQIFYVRWPSGQLFRAD